MKKNKKLAVVVSGWHFPAQFYEMVSKQKLPKDWEMELFCIAHRKPEDALRDKEGHVFEGDRAFLDKKLYSSIISIEQMEKLGWKYTEEPNTVGDWGNSNQWLETNDYNNYDLFLFTHDDNLILTENWFKDIIKDKAFKEWEILCNSLGAPEGWVRGSCEFFKPSLVKKMGGKFDLSMVTLSRVGSTSSTSDLAELNDWNSTVNPLMDFINKNEIKVGYLSPAYRVSAYVIEGERGYISYTHGSNTAREDMGLNFLRQNGII